MTLPPTKILLVEDNLHDVEFLNMVLQRYAEFEVDLESVSSMEAAVASCHDRTYELVILDQGLPDSNGAESVSRIRGCAPDAAIIVVSGNDCSRSASQSIEAGAQDYVVKHRIVGPQFSQTLQHALSRHRQLLQAQADALTDSLTGLANRRGFDLEFERQLRSRQHYAYTCCVALFDIDHFKTINDGWGHEFGDEVIRSVANTLTSNMRQSDLVARYGGEEFAAILPITRIDEAEQIVARCHNAVSAQTLGEPGLQVTVSAGVAELTRNETGRSLLSRADDALYRAKEEGRNQVVVRREHGDLDHAQLINRGTSR